MNAPTPICTSKSLLMREFPEPPSVQLPRVGAVSGRHHCTTEGMFYITVPIAGYGY